MFRRTIKRDFTSHWYGRHMTGSPFIDGATKFLKGLGPITDFDTTIRNFDLKQLIDENATPTEMRDILINIGRGYQPDSWEYLKPLIKTDVVIPGVLGDVKINGSVAKR